MMLPTGVSAPNRLHQWEAAHDGRAKILGQYQYYPLAQVLPSNGLLVQRLKTLSCPIKFQGKYSYTYA